MRTTYALLGLMIAGALLTACGADDEDDGGGGGGSGGATRVISVSRVGIIADGGIETLGSVSTLAPVATLTYTISSTGSAAITLAGGPNYVVASNEVNLSAAVSITQPAAGTIAPSANISFDLDFQVAAAGPFSFDVSIASDADGGQAGPTFDFTVTGTGDNSTRILAVSRTVAIADGATDPVGSVDASTAAPTLTYTLTNSGTGVMSFTGSAPFVTVAIAPAPVNVAGGAGGISITQPATGTIAAGGGTQSFDVDYQVAAGGAFSFTIQFGTDATAGQTGSTFEINVSGTGTVPGRTVAVRRASQSVSDGGTLDLGNRGWGATSYPVRVEIENTGTDPLTLSGSSPWVTVAGSPAPVNITGSPAITQPSGATIAAGAGVFFEFTFEVTALGDFSFTLQFGSNATAGQTGGTFEVIVQGQGHPSFTFEKNFPTTSREPYTNGVDQGAAEIRIVSAGFASGGTQFPNVEPSPNGRYLAYTHQGSGGSDNRNLFVVSVTGGAAVQVTPAAVNSPKLGVSMVWGQNAAGDQLLCLMCDHESSQQNERRIYTCVVSGTPPTVNNFTEVTGWGSVSLTRRAFTAAWSPDGTRLAFQLFTPVVGSPQRELWGCAFSGGVPSLATDIKGSVAFATAEVEIGGAANDYAWADSGTLLYAADGDTQFVPHLYAVPITVSGGGTLVAGAQVKQAPTGAAERVNNYPNGWAISPNGTRVAFVRQGAGFDDAFVANISTAATPPAVALTNGITVQGAAEAQRVAWAPDGLSVAYSGDLEVDDDFELYWQRLTSATGTVALSGTTTRISNTPTNYAVLEFHFSPDGGRILYDQVDFIATSFEELVIATVSTSPTRVTIASGFANATANLVFMRWKPGAGDFIAVNGDISSATRELWVIPLGGPDLMTPGTRYTASGSFTSSQLSNYRWIP